MILIDHITNPWKKTTGGESGLHDNTSRHTFVDHGKFRDIYIYMCVCVFMCMCIIYNYIYTIIHRPVCITGDILWDTIIAILVASGWYIPS